MSVNAPINDSSINRSALVVGAVIAVLILIVVLVVLVVLVAVLSHH